VAGEDHRLGIDQAGPASFLAVGDRFVLSAGEDTREHVVTRDLDSHFEYDGRPDKRLSKDTPVKRVGTPDPGEQTARVVAALSHAVNNLEQTGDMATWANSIADVVSKAVTCGMSDDVLSALEKLERQGSAVFARARVSHGKAAVDDLNVAVRKRWTADVNQAKSRVETALAEGVDVLRQVVREVIQRRGYCLYTRQKNGKHKG
jgi:hypothetical protein